MCGFVGWRARVGRVKCVGWLVGTRGLVGFSVGCVVGARGLVGWLPRGLVGLSVWVGWLVGVRGLSVGWLVGVRGLSALSGLVGARVGWLG